MKKTFDKKALGALVSKKISDCGPLENSVLSKERLNVLKYYNGELPLRTSPGSSSFISRDVFDGVESLKAQLVETFSGGTDIVRFTPNGPMDVLPARLATAFCSYWFWQRNDGERVITSLIHDALMARNGIVKIYWEPETKEDDEKFVLPIGEVEAMSEDPAVLEVEGDINPATGIVTGTLVRETKSGRIVIENVAPEEFFIDLEARDLTAFHGQRTLKRLAEIEKLWPGSKKVLRDLKSDADDSKTEDIEANARRAQIDGSNLGSSEANTSPDDKSFWVKECFMTTAHPDGTRDCLVKVVQVHDHVLAVEEVSRTIFFDYNPFPISHSFYGNSFARLLMQPQNARTALIRAVLDHSAITTNPRYLVEAGALPNPRELLDNRLGGIVNTTRPDAVMPLPQAPLNPFLFQTQDLIRVASEQTTGVSALSMGNDKAVISNQNSAELVAQQVSLAQIRQRLPARALAQTLRAMWFEIHQLAVEHCDRAEWIDVAGEWVEINPKNWSERKNAQVTMHLSPGDREQAAMKKLQFFAQARQDPAISEMITAQNAYQFALDAAEGADIRDVNSYITNPKNIPPKQPDPMMIKKMELEERAIALQEASVKAQADKVQAEFETKMAKLELENVRLQMEMAIKDRDAARKDAETMSRIDIAQREMTAAENAPVMDPAKAIISPN